MNRNTKFANICLQRNGYVVMAFTPGPMPIVKVGQKIECRVDGVEGPFFVAAEASSEEYIDQTRRLQPEFEWRAREVANKALGFFKLVAE